MSTKIDEIKSRFEVMTDWPEYTKPAFEIREGLEKSGVWTTRDWREKTAARKFTDQYLERYDALHEWELRQESRLWQEAMLTTQLSLPYTVVRAIIDEAFPSLVATQIFDTGVSAQNPARIFYEAYFDGESGYEVTVTAEDVTSDEDAWVDLDGAHIVEGSVNVEDNGGSTPYVEGTDYVIDYLEGRLFTLAAGSIGDSTALDVDYIYAAVRKGENAGIERAKAKLRHVDMPLTADRLASEISDETIKFSRSQVGFDGVMRTLNLLAKELMRNIDSALLNTSLSEVLRVANNSGGTWNSASDAITDLVEMIGVAKVKVENRYYEPNFILMSTTNAEHVANWDGFTAAGSRPDASIDPRGFVGTLKGLPVWRSPVFSDAYVLVGNRELVAYRTYGDMSLKGPFPTYDGNGLLVPNEQYFLQEYNGRVTPIPGKGAYVRVI